MNAAASLWQPQLVSLPLEYFSPLGSFKWLPPLKNMCTYFLSKCVICYLSFPLSLSQKAYAYSETEKAAGLEVWYVQALGGYSANCAPRETHKQRSGRCDYEILSLSEAAVCFHTQDNLHQFGIGKESKTREK